MTKERTQVTLKLLRGAKGKTQRNIADALREMGRDASQEYVSQLERGKSVPGVDLAIDLAEAYECSFIELVEALGFQPDRNKRQPEDHGS
jgi:transcriptional regulator with XRE-family HTH domain